MNKYKFFFFVFLNFFSCTDDNIEVIVKDYIKAHNTHEIEDALLFYHQDIIFELKNTWIKKGIEEMKSLEVWDSTMNSNLKLEAFEIKGDSVFCKVIENNDWFKNIDINDLTHDPVIFIIEDKKIKKIIAYPSMETGKKIQESIGSIMEWSQQTNDSTIYQLIHNGEFTYSSDAAKLWLELFKKWKSDQY